MTGDYFILGPPRRLSQIEIVDIHLLVKSTRPILRPVPKKENKDGKQG